MKQRSPGVVDREMGARIRSARLLAHLSQQQLGDALGVSFQQIQKYEKGVNRVGAARLQQIAKAVAVGNDYLMTGSSGGEAASEGASVIVLMCSDSVGRNLAEAFVQITNPAHRSMVAQLARTFLNSQDGARGTEGE